MLIISQLQVASLLFVDNPVGTGFSYVDNKEAYTHDVAGIAADMMVTLKTFFMEKAQQFQVCENIFNFSNLVRIRAADSYCWLQYPYLTV